MEATKIDTPKKRKWAAGLLSALFPGIGHMYAGAMQRGLFFMLLLIGNIFGVVLVSIEGIVPLIVLLAILIPVVYFYTLFDALQTTDRVNAEASRPPYGDDALRQTEPHRRTSGSHIAIALGGLALFGFWATNGSDWMEGFLDGNGSLIAAGALILAGVLVYFSGSGKK